MKKGRILVIDDEYGIRTGVRQILELEGFTVEDAETGKDAFAAMDRSTFDVILIDYRLPDIDGLTLLQAIRSRELDVMTCMITAYANIETAIAATRQGIDFFLPKPFSPDDLIGVVETLLRHKAIREEAETLRLAHEASLLELASEKSQTHSLVENLRDAVLVDLHGQIHAALFPHLIRRRHRNVYRLSNRRPNFGSLWQQVQPEVNHEVVLERRGERHCRGELHRYLGPVPLVRLVAVKVAVNPEAFVDLVHD